MYALLISEENLELLTQVVPPTTGVRPRPNYQTFIKHRVRWYLVAPYVTHYGEVQPWAVMPEYILKQDYEYDHETIDTEWTHIER